MVLGKNIQLFNIVEYLAFYTRSLVLNKINHIDTNKFHLILKFIGSTKN